MEEEGRILWVMRDRTGTGESARDRLTQQQFSVFRLWEARMMTDRTVGGLSRFGALEFGMSTHSVRGEAKSVNNKRTLRRKQR
jgi:hypothetical protein